MIAKTGRSGNSMLRHSSNYVTLQLHNDDDMYDDFDVDGNIR